jgi:hypothetical protein
MQIICKKEATCKKKQGDFNFTLESREGDFAHFAWFGEPWCACWFWWPNNLHICSCLCKTLFELLINMFICFFASHHNTFISHYKYISEVADICKEKHPLTKIEMVHFNVSKIINRTGSTSWVKPPILYML